MAKKGIIIAKSDDLKNGEMITIYPEEGPDILLIRVNDRYYATDAYCPHYDAPLELGIISGKKVMCPWHHALFDVKTGDVEEPPALDGINRYKTEVRDDDVVFYPDEVISKSSEQEEKISVTETNDKMFVIIGGGAAGNAAAKKLRDKGYGGRLMIISADTENPYDRTALSKDFLKGDMNPEWLPLNGEDYYSEKRIELLLGQRVIRVDTKKKTVELETKTKIEYDKLLIATGGRPKTLNIPGKQHENIFTLRSLTDAKKILQAAEGNKNQIAIVGASFIGLETAESLLKEGRTIHVIAPETLPFEPLLGAEIGKMIKQKMEAKGIRFHLGHTVTEFQGPGELNNVVLDDGSRIKADMAILGIGVEPVTDFMPQFDKVKDGSLLCDAHLQVEDDVFAAGDVATFPYWKTGDLIRIEHWRVAEQQGNLAAMNMLDHKRKLEIIPFFWTSLADNQARYVGHPGDWNETIVHGDVSKDGFIIYYAQGDQINAALGVNRDAHMALIEELLKRDNMPAVHELKNEILSLDDLRRLL